MDVGRRSHRAQEPGDVNRRFAESVRTLISALKNEIYISLDVSGCLPHLKDFWQSLLQDADPIREIPQGGPTFIVRSRPSNDVFPRQVVSSMVNAGLSSWPMHFWYGIVSCTFAYFNASETKNLDQNGTLSACDFTRWVLGWCICDIRRAGHLRQPRGSPCCRHTRATTSHPEIPCLCVQWRYEVSFCCLHGPECSDPFSR